MLTATHILIGAAISAVWVASLYLHPFGRCIRCYGKRVIIRGKPRKAKPGKKPKMPRTVTCPLCKGVGRRQRFGSRTVHRLADVTLPGSKPAYLRVLSPVEPIRDSRIAHIDPPRRLMTMQEAAEQLGVSKSTMQKLVRSGQIKTVRPGPQIVRVEVAELDAYLARLTGTSPVVPAPPQSACAQRTGLTATHAEIMLSPTDVPPTV